MILPLLNIWRVLSLYVRQQRNYIHVVLLNSLILPGVIAYLGSRMVNSREGLIQWLSASIALALGIGPMTQVGYCAMIDRFANRLPLLRNSPVPKYAYVEAMILLALVQCVVVIVLACGLFAVLGVGRLTTAGVMAGVLAAVGAGFSLGGFSVALAFRARDMDTGKALISMASYGLVLLSPVFYSLNELPRLARPLAFLIPFTFIEPMTRAAIEGQSAPVWTIEGCLVLAIALNIISYRCVPWCEE